jgi:peroxiredoxin
MKEGVVLPVVDFQTRVRDETISGPNPYRWETVSSSSLFGEENINDVTRRVVLFSLPGAFTPTCSTYQLPGFEKKVSTFRKLGIDEIYCMSVNDAFVMNCWAKQQSILNVKVIPDGSGRFTRQIGMLVDKDNLGFGYRSWRYAAVIKNGVVEKWFEEPGREDNHEEDPYGETSPENVLAYLESL